MSLNDTQGKVLILVLLNKGMKYSWPLMENTVGDREKRELINFIKNTDRFTNGKKVLEFEKNWSGWQNCKYSVFVNSGSSANLLLLWALKEKHFQNKEMVVLTPSCTWATNISSMIQLGIDFVVADNDMYNFGISEESLIEAKQNYKEINVIFVTHLLGSPSDIDMIKKHFPKAILIEDCCESHGATYNGKKVGNFGIASTFSFYYGHHMTTIEGGMVCTNDEELYNLLRIMRSHGMSRESLDEDYKEKLSDENPNIDSKFLFPYTGFNVRNTELNAVLGNTQLKQLNEFITIRKRNLKEFDKIVKNHDKILKPFNLEGNSAMVFPLLCESKEIKESLIRIFEENGIETRPFLIGNFVNQPFVKHLDLKTTNIENSEYFHDCGFYIGNNHLIPIEKIQNLDSVINLIYRELYLNL